jgi:hypothetical protein
MPMVLSLGTTRSASVPSGSVGAPRFGGALFSKSSVAVTRRGAMPWSRGSREQNIKASETQQGSTRTPSTQLPVHTPAKSSSSIKSSAVYLVLGAGPAATAASFA